MRRNVLPLALAVSLCAAPALALSTGEPGYTDPRIKTFVYDRNQVYRIVAHFGYATTIQVGKGERVLSAVSGDNINWKVQPLERADLVSIVPLDHSGRFTNLTITSDRHIYHFDMVARHPPGVESSDMTFSYRFIYPETEEDRRRQALVAASRDDAMSNARGEGMLNTAYRAKGDGLMRPTAMFDDGHKTYLTFDRRASRPAVFSVARDGAEASVNTSTLADGTLVVHSVRQQFTLRGRDGDVVCIFNDDLIAADRASRASTFTMATQHDVRNVQTRGDK